MRKNKALAIFSILVFAFLFVPLIIIAVTAFGEAATITFPIKGFTFKWFGNVFASPSFMDSLALSAKLALFATLLALLVGIPAAYTLARFTVKGKEILKSFFFITYNCSGNCCWVFNFPICSFKITNADF